MKSTSDPRASGNQLFIRTKLRKRGILLSDVFNKTPGKTQMRGFFKVRFRGNLHRVAPGGTPQGVRSVDHLLGVEAQRCVSVSPNKCPISEAFIFL